jgi:hypothetical protein
MVMIRARSDDLAPDVLTRALVHSVTGTSVGVLGEDDDVRRALAKVQPDFNHTGPPAGPRTAHGSVAPVTSRDRNWAQFVTSGVLPVTVILVVAVLMAACGSDGAGAVKAVEPTALVAVLVTDDDDVGMTT